MAGLWCAKQSRTKTSDWWPLAKNPITTHKISPGPLLQKKQIAGQGLFYYLLCTHKYSGHFDIVKMAASIKTVKTANYLFIA